MKFMTIISCLLLVVVFSCTSEDLKVDGVNIRLENKTEYDFSDIKVYFDSRKTYLFDDLPSGEYSTYQKFEFAYRYAAVELLVDSDTFSYVPVDFVGESTLPSGKYTYQIFKDTVTHNDLIVEYIED